MQKAAADEEGLVRVGSGAAQEGLDGTGQPKPECRRQRLVHHHGDDLRQKTLCGGGEKGKKRDEGELVGRS